MTRRKRSDAIGTIAWTERTGGVLRRDEQAALALPLLRGHRAIIAGRIAMALKLHAGRRTSIDPSSLTPPDSALAREAEAGARALLSPAVLNHSYRSFAWGAALAAVDQVAFDRELLYVAALFHDTGIPSPVPDVDFTVRSAAMVRPVLAAHDVALADQEVVTNAIALHHTPGVDLSHGPEAFLLSAGAAVDVFGLRSNHVPDFVRSAVVLRYPRLGFKHEFAGLFRAEARRVPHGRAWYLHRFAMSDITIRLAAFRE
ncbi:HD domain-containing protein [Mycolicibacterium sp. P1-5]|uniref:HD domain-containing protein n=1 Tax=Mycolicibacterium sp. P1-5 TaxID=2024617 RepID=UPI0011ED07AC|nr:HD domain-containing protein [Mycolicibacterium sp. P1-5]KAA0110800.1 HD domain-containing protein [Mycolicibacterium sp. P1-5]